MQKATTGGKVGSSAALQTKPSQPKHNMTVVELSTPHIKLPGIQRYTPEDLKLMVEKAKQFPQVHEGFYLQIQNYDFEVDEWELETGNSQPHSDESKVNLRPSTAVTTAASRRLEQMKKSKETRNQLNEKMERERNPTFKRPQTATVVEVKKTASQGIRKKDEEKQSEKEEKDENIIDNKSECNSDEQEDIRDNEEENTKQVEEVNESENVTPPPKGTKQILLEQKKSIAIKQKMESKQKEDKRKTGLIEDVYDIDGNEETVHDSFEKMSISMTENQMNRSNQSLRESIQQGVKQKNKGPYKSDVANMMSSMFSELSGFDTDI